MRRRFAARLPLCVFALLLVFKAAVPMLASVAAAAQGRAVGEICSVWGVSLPAATLAATATAVAADPHAHHHHEHAEAPAESAPTGHPGSGDTTSHGSDHCALTALAALAAGGGAQALPFTTAHMVTVAPEGAAPTARLDAAARWAARLRHGPPWSV